MKSGFAIFVCVLLLPDATLHAQSVYVTPGEHGPVFSDKPQPGAREISLPPLTIIAPQPESKAAPSASTENSAEGNALPAYRSFRVVFPEDNGSVMASTAIFEVRLAAEPPLQFGAGHAYAVSINGRAVGMRFTANEFMIPPEFWDDTLPPANQSLQLDASIVDGNGQVIKRAAPVRFQMRLVNNINRPRLHPQPQPPPLKPLAPRAKPEPANGGATKRIDQ